MILWKARRRNFPPGARADGAVETSYIIRCDDFKKDEQGNITEIYASYLPETQSGNDTSGIKVKGTIHWLSVPHAKTARVNLYDRLFHVENPSDAEGDFKDYINPDSLRVIENAYIEPMLAAAQPGDKFQFLRMGYFCVDTDSKDGQLIFNRTVSLKDSWAKEKNKG